MLLFVSGTPGPANTMVVMGGTRVHIPRVRLARAGCWPRPWRGATVSALMLGALAIAPLAGCFSLDVANSSFSASSQEVWAEWHRLRDDPAPLARPVVVLNGYHGSHLRGLNLGADLAKLTSQNRGDFLVLSYPFAHDIPSVAARITREINQRWPSSEPGRTVEVDVVGFSMGGLVARYAAMPADRTGQDLRLNIHHLYTLSTPHRGARAAIVPMDPAVRQMMAGSSFLCTLDECQADAGYPIVAYTQTNDKIVGARNASPAGAEPIWTGGTTMFSHFTITTNRRVLVDIARRLRAEEPLAAQGSRPPSH